jgi:ATP-dependent helicase/nuclease subunit A
MESPRENKNSLTLAQQRAVAARGNVLVMAGAGTGKTKTLVERCLDCLEHDGAQIDELLVVTFTEAAAAEMRDRLRRAIEAKTQASALNSQPATLNFWQEQLARFDFAHIGTLHGFCLKLVREHFYELGLDPRLAILDEGEARQLASDTLDAQFQSHYEGADEFSRGVQELIQVHGGGRDESIRGLILRLHNYSQARPDAAGWLAQQRETFSAAAPAAWQQWLLEAIADWRNEWLPVLTQLGAPVSDPARSANQRAGSETGAPEANVKAAELSGILSRLPQGFSRETAAEILAQAVAADADWPRGTKTKFRPPLKDFFDEAQFLLSLAAVKNGADPLTEDWSWVHQQMKTLLRMTEEFARRLDERKRADGVVDFHDLEQFALKLLWDFSTGQATEVAASWREKLKFIFVDEYQDINAAQDKIIAGLSRSAPVPGAATHPAENAPAKPSASQNLSLAAPGDGRASNRFLVGDVKQSIYRFRLADPQIFRDYARLWHAGAGETIPLSENFRSREGLLNFVNQVFRVIMREEVGGVAYDADAELRFGAPETRAHLSVAGDTEPRAELIVRFKNGRDGHGEDESEPAGLDDAQREARMVAWRLKQFVAAKREIFDDQTKAFRPAEWRDMAVLLRAPRGKSAIFAKEFERAGIPLAVARGGFYESAEILDLLSLLQVLDNPLQDAPCIAVLRSPLVGLSLDELAEIRLAARGHFWTALNRLGKAEGGKAESGNFFAKVSRFLDRFSRWRTLAKQVSLSQCLEEILAETLYADWLRAQPQGSQRAANIAGFLQLAQQFDQFQRQGLFRFLKFIEAQQAAAADPEVLATATENAVRLMSIHQSKGLEFPIVVLADLAKNFNDQDLRGEIIFDEQYGLCPKVQPPQTGRRYPSLTHWLAQRRQRRELRGEELRLLYVALTRARDNLILTASVTEKSWEQKWRQPQPVTAHKIAGARSFADWLALWFGVRCAECAAGNEAEGTLPEMRWQVVADADLNNDPAVGHEPLGVGKELAPSRGDSAAGVEALRARLEWQYPFQAATQRKAKSSVTALRREAEELEDEAEQMIPPVRKRKADSGQRKLSAAETGAAHHRFLQHVALDQTANLVAEADRLARENHLSADERAVLDLKALAAFWESALGKNIVAHSREVRRELPFTARFSPAEIAAITGARPDAGMAGEFIVVQGVADLVVLLPNEIWLVDFKTDDLRKNELAGKIKLYRPQLQLYAAALEKIFARKVTVRALHFLSRNHAELIESW